MLSDFHSVSVSDILSPKCQDDIVVADMVADMEVDKVADMEVDMVAFRPEAYPACTSPSLL